MKLAEWLLLLCLTWSIHHFFFSVLASLEESCCANGSLKISTNLVHTVKNGSRLQHRWSLYGIVQKLTWPRQARTCCRLNLHLQLLSLPQRWRLAFPSLWLLQRADPWAGRWAWPGSEAVLSGMSFRSFWPSSLPTAIQSPPATLTSSLLQVLALATFAGFGFLSFSESLDSGQNERSGRESWNEQRSLDSKF